MLDEAEEQQLERWVTCQLTAMEQSNPQVLARTIVSLVKGDRESQGDREAHCVVELKSYLQEEAAGFAKILFQALGDESYKVSVDENEDEEEEEQPEMELEGAQEVAQEAPLALSEAPAPPLPPLLIPSLKGRLGPEGGGCCRGKWGMSDASHDLGLVSDFEFRLVQASDSAQQFPRDGRYVGWFLLKQSPPLKSSVKVEDREMMFKFVKREGGEQEGGQGEGQGGVQGVEGVQGEGGYVIEGNGVNKFGSFTLKGSLSDEGDLHLYREYYSLTPHLKRPGEKRRAGRPPLSLGIPSAEEDGPSSSSRDAVVSPREGGRVRKQSVAMQEYQDRSTPKAPTPRVASKSAPPAPPAPREKEPKERGPRLSAPMKRCSEVLRELAKQPQGVWFLEPVDYVKMGIPDYPRVIKRPMDLGLVGSNVESGVYEGCEGFAEDVRQVFRNALLFNTDKVNPVNIAARELAARFEDRYRLLTAQLGLAPAPEAAKRGRPSLGGKKAKSPRSLKVARTGLGPRASSAPALSAGGAMDGNMQILEMQRMMDEMRQEISSLRSAVRVEEVPLTFEEKKAVIDAIHRLPPDKMEQVLDIIQAALPPQTDDGEIEVPLDLLDTFTLRKLQQFIVEQKKGGKRPRKGGGAQSAAPPSPSLLGGVGLPEEDLSLFEEGEDMLFAADSFDEPP